MARDKGTGSVYRTADGRWRGSMEAGWTRSGTRRRITVTAATKSEAQRKLRDKFLAASTEDTGASITMTVKRYADDWLTRRVAERRPKAQERDEGVIRQWVIPAIGHRRLSALTPGDIRAVHTAILKAGLSPASARRAHTALRKMLKDATVDGHAVPPRVLLVTPPAVVPTDREGPSVAQAVALLAAARDDPLLSRWAAALLQGMRQGECLGLTWGAVDLDRGIIDISWQMQPLPYVHGCDAADPCGRARAGSCPAKRFKIPLGYEVRPVSGQMCLVRPKTARGQRIIPLVPWMIETLKRHGDVTGMDAGSLVWTDDAGRPIGKRDDLAAWHALQDRAGVSHPSGRPFHVHEARHSTATLLMEAGVPESVRIAIIGHSKAATTRIYEHAGTDQARAALELVADRLGLTA